MLTGRRLFNAPGDAAMMLQIVEGEIPPPRTINPNVPEALEAVVDVAHQGCSFSSLLRDAGVDIDITTTLEGGG